MNTERSFISDHLRGFLALLACALAVPRVGAVDGTCWQNYTSPAVKWSQHTYSWVNCIVARDGGVATLHAAAEWPALLA